jgi:hypothetical protein
MSRNIIFDHKGRKYQGVRDIFIIRNFVVCIRHHKIVRL